jgi:DNA-binding NarL/FixJ family response regulator
MAGRRGGGYEGKQEAGGTGQGTPHGTTAPVRLTPREMQVLELVAQGMTNKMIAWQLQISVHMVKVHVSHILEKLAVTSRTQAAIYYVRQGWGRDSVVGSGAARSTEADERGA